MWVYLNDSFLSIVKHRTRPGFLLVRGRVMGDIERAFPRAEVERTPNADYLYRAAIERETVAAALANEVKAIDYANFKDSVEDEDRHAAYMQCWSIMAGWQYADPDLADPWLSESPAFDEDEGASG